MKIAILGSRGIPANYGGFETFAEELSLALTRKGYRVTVSCEYEPPERRYDDYQGVKLTYFPLKPPGNYFLRKFYETFYDLYSLLKLSRKNDVIYFLGTEVGLFLFLPHLLKRKIKLLVNVDGVMWQRTKYSFLEKLILKLFHDLACRFSDIIIIDSREMEKYIKPHYQSKTEYISYGVHEIPSINWDKRKLSELNLTDRKLNSQEYWLLVARLEPENNIEMVLDAFLKYKSAHPLLIVGDFTSTSFQKKITDKIENNPHIILVGSIYNQQLLNMLRQHTRGYIHGHSVGGTNPSLLEAMIMKNIILAHDNSFNREVCGKTALYFKDSTELAKIVVDMEENLNNYFKYKDEAFHKLTQAYMWDKIIKEYYELFNNLK